jgi:hypothetical protein
MSDYVSGCVLVKACSPAPARAVNDTVRRQRNPWNLFGIIPVVFGLTVRGACASGQRDCKHTPVVALLAREVEGCGRVWGG